MFTPVSRQIQSHRFFSIKTAVSAIQPVTRPKYSASPVQQWRSPISTALHKWHCDFNLINDQDLIASCLLIRDSALAMNFVEKTMHSNFPDLHNLENLENFQAGIGYEEIFDFFYRKRFSNFASFFLNSLIDVPGCFKVSASLYRTHHNNFLYKLLALNLKCGRFETANSRISRVLFSLSWNDIQFANSLKHPSFLNILLPLTLLADAERGGDYKKVTGTLVKGGGDYPKLLLDDEDAIERLQRSVEGDIIQLPIRSWCELPSADEASNDNNDNDNDSNKSSTYQFFEGGECRFRLYNQRDGKPTQWVLRLTEAPSPTLLLKYWHEIDVKGRMMNYDNRLVVRFEQICQQINPIFNFFSYKTSKTIWKFSRGKAGRYFFMWKYVPFYKRELLILRWLKHEFRIAPVKQEIGRFEMGLNRMLTFDNNHPFAKRKRFINNFIFREYRFSLMRHFRTRK